MRLLPLIVWILSSHWSGVTGVGAPIGHWPPVLMVTMMGVGMGLTTRTQARHMAGSPGLARAWDVEDPLEKHAGAIL